MRRLLRSARSRALMPSLSASTRIGVPCSSVPETMSTSCPAIRMYREKTSEGTPKPATWPMWRGPLAYGQATADRTVLIAVDSKGGRARAPTGPASPFSHGAVEHRMPPVGGGTAHVPRGVVEERDLFGVQALAELVLDPRMRKRVGAAVRLGGTEIRCVQQEPSARAEEGRHLQVVELLGNPVGAVGQEEHRRPRGAQRLQLVQDLSIDPGGGGQPPPDHGVGTLRRAARRHQGGCC